MLSFNLIAIAVLALCQQISAGSDYEVWAVDQSNSVAGQSALGVQGSFLWVYNSKDIERQVDGEIDQAPSQPCTPGASKGPCDLLDIFPQDLEGFFADGTSSGVLSELGSFARFHYARPDMSGKYVLINMFLPGGGYIGVVDSRTKEAVGLFRTTKFQYATDSEGNTAETRSVHMSDWGGEDSTYIIINNLHGKAVERINVLRNRDGDIKALEFDRSASLGLGSNMKVVEEATYFVGENAYGRELIGSIVGDYDEADLGDATPNDYCKENGCGDYKDGSAGGRGKNLPVCSLVSENDFVYITLAGGGLLVADFSETPLKIVAEYGKSIIYGAGLCGTTTPDGQVFVNSGVSASAAGLNQSMFAVWSFEDDQFANAFEAFPENQPMPTLVYQDEDTNTKTGGNTIGPNEINTSGQIPGETTRRDSHGMTVTKNGDYVQGTDRIQNVVEVFDAQSLDRYTYDLTSSDGDQYSDEAGACLAHSVSDDENLPLNDPAPDQIASTPDGKYMVLAFRGPAPVTFNHASQGSCPGVGIVKRLKNGKSGKLISVIRTSNTIADTFESVVNPGGHEYTGSERSDVHGIVVVHRQDRKPHPRPSPKPF